MNILTLAEQIGINPKWVAGTQGGEYHSSCPVCGGKDRFYIQPHRQMRNCLGMYKCRQCGVYGDTIQFAREFLNLSFQESIQTLNVTIKEPNISIHQNTNYFKPAALKNPPDKWTQQATEFVSKAHKRILHEPKILKYLENRGLNLEAIKNYKVGWTNKNEYMLREDWGLPKKLAENKGELSLWIPMGIVIPTIKANGEVIRLKIRQCDLNGNSYQSSKYVIVSESMNGLSVIGDPKNTTLIVVESELDAYALNYATSDFACTVAVGSNIRNPDILTDYYAKKSKLLLICYDNDDAGQVMLNKWKKLYPHAMGYATPIGKDIGEAIQSGLNIREWFLKANNL